MERRSIIQVFVKPNGTQRVRAFTLKDFIRYHDDGIISALEEVLHTRSVSAQVGHHYKIQKNRMNNQIVTQNRDKDFPKLCVKQASINIIELTMKCGAKYPKDLRRMFQTDEGTFAYLAGDMITKYY